MKKILGLALVVVSLGAFELTADARTNEFSSSSVTVAANAEPQWQTDRYGRRVYNRRRYVRRTRVVRLRGRLYRETLLVTYLPNGRIIDTDVISRVRIS